MRSILGLSTDEIKDYLVKNSFESFRVKQIFDWLYNKKVTEFDSMANLPKLLKEMLKSDFFITSLSEIERKVSNDGTQKIGYKTIDGNIIESVMIPNSLGKYTLCISTQVGCPIGCSFCATGINGFKRNLTLDEILSQYYLNHNDVSNIVLMGMGEPFLNPNIWDFLKIMTDKEFFNFSSRSITVSTVGIIEGIKRLLDFNKQIRLAISYHSGIAAIRRILFPKVFETINFETLIETLKNYSDIGKRVTFEYLLIKDVNDNREEVKILKDISKKIDFHLNIIPYNNHRFSNYKSPTDNDIKRFISYLEGVKYTIRRSKGQDIFGACGQLAGEKNIIL